ncbi:MAG TPA: glycosyltransferase, partial [Acidimicrobiales bacterium]|nr:glycosyltransferase [Acidimicrobiales bacterium]
SLDRLTRLPERPRIVVVDNGSSDGTAAAIAGRFPGVELVCLGENLGAAGRNVGVERLDTPYVAFSDDDTWWEPGSLRRAADLLDAHSRVALLTGRILVGLEEASICRALENSPLPSEPGLPGRPLLGFLAGASVARRSALREAGGFDPRFFIGGEEEVLALDLVTRGWQIRYVPDLVAHHAPSQRRDVPRRNRTQVRNALWVAWLRRPWPGALRCTFVIGRSALRDRATRQGLAAALGGLPWVLRERRVVPPEIERQIRLLESNRIPTSDDMPPVPRAAPPDSAARASA